MPRQPEAPAEKRLPLTRERVLHGAIAVAQTSGIGSLTMRSLARELGVKPMALYHHVASKEAILDGIIDVVFGEIELPSADTDWRTALRRRSVSAREVLGRHRWAIALMDSRQAPGPATLRQHDAVLRTLRQAGFSMELTAHVYALLDSYVYGFALQEASFAFESDMGHVLGAAEAFLEHFPATEFPDLAAFVTGHVLQPDYDFGAEFEFGLDQILEVVGRLLDPPRPQP